MNPFSNVSEINCSDLNAVLTWHRSKVEEIETYEMTDAQLKIHLRELNGGIAPNLGRNPSRVEIINVPLDHAAKEMTFTMNKMCG